MTLRTFIHLYCVDNHYFNSFRHLCMLSQIILYSSVSQSQSLTEY